MSKINYPENETLASLVSKPFNDISQSLTSALNYCAFNVPRDFRYLQYLRDIGGIIDGYRNDLTSIFNACENIDKGFRATLDSIDSMNNNLNTDVIDERERLIK